MTSGDAQRWRRLRDELEALPQQPVSAHHPRHWIFRLKRAADFIGHARPQHARFFRKVNPYPKPFRHVTFRTEDGVQIAAWYGPPHGDDDLAHAGDAGTGGGGAKRAKRRGQAMASGEAPAAGPKASAAATRSGSSAPESAALSSLEDDPGFGLVIVPGMFSTKDDTAHKRRVIRIWRGWRIPVLCIDQRAFGESTGIATGGWKEAYDVHAAARFLAREAGIARIGVMAESLGGSATLNALALDSRSGTDLMNGGVLVWSAFVDARDAVHYITAEPPREHPFRSSWGAFRRLLSFRSMGGYESFEDYLEDAARVNGLESVEELYDLANPKWKIGMMHAPTLLIHAADDPVVPVRHARRMERYAREHPHIQVLVTSWGGHTAFEAMDPWWYWEVLRRWFGAVNGVDLPNLERPGDREAAVATTAAPPTSTPEAS